MMRLPNILVAAALVLLCVSSGCARGIGSSHVPASDSQLVRMAELPERGDYGDPQPAAFATACAMLLRDAKTGQKYLLTRSYTRTTVATSGNSTTMSLASATGEYAPVLADNSLQTPRLAQLRVDCTSSRIIDRTSAPNTR